MLEELVDTPTTARLKAAKARKSEDGFFRVNRMQACEVNRVHPHALIIWMELRRQQAMRWRPPFVIGDEGLQDIGILPRTLDRVLAALERAGYVRVERKRGRLPRIWLEDRAVPSAKQRAALRDIDLTDAEIADLTPDELSMLLDAKPGLF